jgi:hypothetical protein
MKIQGWKHGVPADFVTIGNFMDRVGDLRNGGGERLAAQIEARHYRLVFIDTFSRAIAGDQNDVAEMTNWLTPLQQMAHDANCAVVLIDHHRKRGGFDVDVIADILGSTAKGAMADTILGLYRERGKPGARLAISGREVEEQALNLRIDWITGCWQLDKTGETLPERQAEIFDALKELGPAGTSDIAKAVNVSRGEVYQALAALEAKGYACKVGVKWDWLRNA